MRNDETPHESALGAARFLKEMQDQARENVLAAYRFENNTVRGSCIEMIDLVAMGRRNLSVRFELNGEPIEVRSEIDDHKLRAAMDKQAAFGMVVEVVAKAVTDEVLRQGLSSFAESFAKTK